MSKHLQDPVCSTHSHSHSHSRRRFLKMCAGAVAAAGVMSKSAFAKSIITAPERALSFYNIHTGESLKTAYWAEGNYVPEALSEINFLLRDFRTGDVKAIDPNLLDLLHLISQRLDGSKPIHLISGYRSPATNAQLHVHHSGVAKHSLHMQGLASDIRIPGHDLKQLLKVAVEMHGGGVGYYRQSDFVHVDVGRVRHWGF